MKNEEGIGESRIICPVSDRFQDLDDDDIRASREALAESDERIPYEQVQRELGLDRSTLGERLREHRRRVVATGRPLLGWDELRE